MNYEKNVKILSGLENAMKGIAGEGPFSFEIKGRDGKLTKVSKEEFAKWMGEGKEKEKNIKSPPKEKLVVGASGDIDGTTVFTEIISKDGFIRKSYSWPRSEEDKKRIIERNQKRREQELKENKKDLEQQTQNQENFPNSDKKDQQVEKENNQQNQSQKIAENKGSSDEKVFYGIGAASLVVLAISMLAVWIKKKRWLK